MGVIREFVSTNGLIYMVRSLYVEPVRHDMILRMPRVTQKKVRVRPQQEAITVRALGGNERVCPSAFSTALISSEVTGV